MSRSTSLPLSQLAWYHSIALNNEGLDHLKDGRIREGHDVLLLASKIHQQASFDSNFDDCGAYCNNWMNIASGVNSIQTSSSNKEEMHYVFPYGLRIQTGSSQLIATDDDNGDCSKMKCCDTPSSSHPPSLNPSSSSASTTTTTSSSATARW